MADRFELENKILALYSLSDDLDVVISHALESELDADDVANALIGLSVINRLKVDDAFQAFKAAFKLDEYTCDKDAETHGDV